MEAGKAPQQAAAVAVDTEKLDKLKEKYAQVKQANAVLKRGLLEKQEEFSSMGQQLKEKEASERQQLEEIDQLQFQNGRLLKQISSLNAQLEDLQKNKQQSGWSVQGLITGKQQLEAMQRAEGEKRVVSAELSMKIEENEGLHVQIFENRGRNDEAAEKLQAVGTAARTKLAKLDAELQTEREQCEQQGARAQALAERLRDVHEQISQAEALKPTLQKALEDEKEAVKRYMEDLQMLLSLWVPSGALKAVKQGHEMEPQHVSGQSDQEQQQQQQDSQLQQQGPSQGNLASIPAASLFDSSQTAALASELKMQNSQLAEEAEQYAQRLQDLLSEKAKLADELRSLQDEHAILETNDMAKRALLSNGSNGSNNTNGISGKGGVAGPPAAGASAALSSQLSNGASQPPRGGAGAGGGGWLERPSDVPMSSWQRALVESPSITAQESSGLHQHGFFVHAVGLPSSDSGGGQAAGPPELDAFNAWELTVRKLYQEHTRCVQAELQAADSHVIEQYFAAQSNAEKFKEHEEVQQQLANEVSLKHQQLERVQQEMAKTRKKYDTQLVALTEDICKLTGQIAEKDAGIAFLQDQRLKCGHCGKLNPLGKLLSAEIGCCKTCNQKMVAKM